MKWNATNNQINQIIYIKKGRREDCPSWLDYDKLWSWFDDWFKRTGYNDGFYRSVVEAENERLLEKKKRQKNIFRG